MIFTLDPPLNINQRALRCISPNNSKGMYILLRAQESNGNKSICSFFSLAIYNYIKCFHPGTTCVPKASCIHLHIMQTCIQNLSLLALRDLAVGSNISKLQDQVVGSIIILCGLMLHGLYQSYNCMTRMSPYISPY